MWELVEARAAASPDVVALFDGDDREITFAEFRDRAERVAAGLRPWASATAPGSPGSCPTRIETVVRLASPWPASARCRTRSCTSTGRRRWASPSAPDRRRVRASSPATWNGFDFAAMAERSAPSTASTRTGAGHAFADLPEGDPATLPPRRPPTATRSAGSTSPRAPRRTPRACSHTDAHAHHRRPTAWPTPLDMTADDVGSIAFPFAHIAGPDYFGMMLLAGLRRRAGRGVRARRGHRRCSPRNGVTMVGGGTAFYQMYLAEQRKQPGTPIIPTLRKLSGGGAPMPPGDLQRGQARDGHQDLPRLRHDRVPDDLPGRPRTTPTSSSPTPTGKPGHRPRDAHRHRRRHRRGADGRRRRGPGARARWCSRATPTRPLDRRGVRRRRLVPHRRPRPPRPRRPRRAHRPAQGRHHPQGREHLGQGDRGPALRPPQGRRRRRDRPARPRAGRAGVRGGRDAPPAPTPSRSTRWSPT